MIRGGLKLQKKHKIQLHCQDIIDKIVQHN